MANPALLGSFAHAQTTYPAGNPTFNQYTDTFPAGTNRTVLIRVARSKFNSVWSGASATVDVGSGPVTATYVNKTASSYATEEAAWQVAIGTSGTTQSATVKVDWGVNTETLGGFTIEVWDSTDQTTPVASNVAQNAVSASFASTATVSASQTCSVGITGNFTAEVAGTGVTVAQSQIASGTSSYMHAVAYRSGAAPSLTLTGAAVHAALSIVLNSDAAGAGLTFAGTVPSQTGAVSSVFSWSGSALSSCFSGGTTPYAYSVFSGTLPAGLTINSSTGVISGTPTTAGTATIVVRVTDSAGSPATADSNSFTITVTAPDTTPPTLTSPTGTSTGSTTATGTVSTNEATGTLYRLASTNATETAATIKAAALTQTVTATGVQSVSFSGLTASTTYYAHYVHRDAAGNDSAAANSASFTTSAGGGGGGTITTDVIKNWSGTVQASTTIPYVAFMTMTGSLALLLTNQTTNGSGVLTVTNAALTSGTSYMMVMWNADGSLRGIKKFTAA